MKKMNRLLFIIFLVFASVVCIGNIYIAKINFEDEGRIDKVSMNRIEKALIRYEEENRKPVLNLEELVISTGETYQGIVCLNSISKNASKQEVSDFFTKDPEIDGRDYRILVTDTYYYYVGYEVNTADNRRMIVLFNVVVMFSFVFVLTFWFYIKIKVIKPFHQLSEVPFELSKGNLSVPLQENKDKLFGRFIWGMDLLRENLEENKMKELELQRERKMLLLSLSHDIKTPLSAIKLYAKAMSRNLYKDEKKKLEIAGNIDEKVDEIERYISDIVRASNEDFLHFEVNNGEFYVKDAIEQIREYYQDKMQLNQIVFDIADYRNCLVYGDKERFIEVIQNVIENAIKYGDGKRIWLDMTGGEEEYIICIYNTGCQMEDRELPHIFDSFFRGTNVEKKPGSGLGLYICRQLMHLMDGEITASVVTKEEHNIMMVQVVVRLV